MTKKTINKALHRKLKIEEIKRLRFTKDSYLKHSQTYLMRSSLGQSFLTCETDQFLFLAI